MKNYASNRVRNVVLLGHSGSGKTTLCNLIARFWDVTDGRIAIGGVDIRRCIIPVQRRDSVRWKTETLCPTMKQKKFAVRFRSIHL